MSAPIMLGMPEAARDQAGISLLVPDMPDAHALLPYLQQIDAAHWYSNFGPLMEGFETALWQRFFASHTVERSRVSLCATGTAALELALASLSLPVGARVLVPAFTFPATALAVVRFGFQPVFADVDARHWQLTPDIAYAALARHAIDAVMPVATLGRPVDSQSWDAFSLNTGLPIVIDAAPALGFQSPAQRCYTCFSLHATKTLGVGEGGIVVTPKAVDAVTIRELSNFGFRQGAIQTAGSNAKLSEYHAAVGLAQLDRLEELVARRNHVNLTYASALQAADLPLQLQGNVGNPFFSAVGLQAAPFWAAAPVLVPPGRYDAVLAALEQAGIGWRRWYTPALHHQPVFAAAPLATEDGFLPVTETITSRIIGLPSHHFLQERDIDYIVRVLKHSLDDKKQHNEKRRHHRTTGRPG